MSRLGDALARPTSPALAQRCRASGWGLRRACTDRGGHARCPVCDAVVDALPSARHGAAVRVIEEHRTMPASSRVEPADLPSGAER